MDRQEVVQPGGWPLEFNDPEQALQFLEDLRIEFGPEVELRIQGLDSLGLPLEIEPEFLNLDATYPDPPAITPRERLTMHVAKAVFLNQAPEFRRELLLALYRDWLPARNLQALERLEPAVLMAFCKSTLPPEVASWASVHAALKLLER